jgi:hypothetical protein
LERLHLMVTGGYIGEDGNFAGGDPRMQMVARRTREQERMVRKNRWDLQQQTIGHDLHGHTLVIIGLRCTGCVLTPSGISGTLCFQPCRAGSRALLAPP